MSSVSYSRVIDTNNLDGRGLGTTMHKVTQIGTQGLHPQSASRKRVLVTAITGLECKNCTELPNT